MKLLKKIKRWVDSLLKKKKHFFEEQPKSNSTNTNYLPYLPLGHNDKMMYKSKISRNPKTLVRSGLKSSSKKN